MSSEVQETIDQALISPRVPRVFIHLTGGCNGWVLFDLRGGKCLQCGTHPVPEGEYAKPSARAERAA